MRVLIAESVSLAAQSSFAHAAMSCTRYRKWPVECDDLSLIDAIYARSLIRELHMLQIWRNVARTAQMLGRSRRQ